MEKMKKSPIKRLIALWIAFVLAVVPFATHLGGKDGAKAEGEREQEYTKPLTLTMSATEADFVLLTNVVDGQTSVAVDAFGDNDKTIKFVNQMKIKIPNISLPGDSPVTVTLGADEYKVTGWDVKVSTDSKNYAKSDDGELKTEISGLQTDGQKVYVYVKPVFSADTPFPSSCGYTKVGTFTLNKVEADSILSAAPTWGEAVTVAKTATLSYPATDSYAGIIKYGVLQDGKSENEIRWSNSADALSFSDGDGKYKGYVGYFITSASWESPIAKKATTDTITIDNTAPLVTWKLKKGTAEGTAEVAASGSFTGGAYYIDKNDTATYTFEAEISDANPGSVKYTYNGGTETAVALSAEAPYKTTVTGLEPVTVEATDTTTAAPTLVVKDALGNSTGTITLPKLVKVDQSLHFAKEPVLTVVGDADADPTKLSYTNKKLKLEFDVEYVGNISDFKVYMGDEDMNVQMPSPTTLENGNKLYKFSKEIPEWDSYKSIGGIRIYIADKDGNTEKAKLEKKVTTNTIIYDNQKPQISETKLMVQNGTNWDVIPWDPWYSWEWNIGRVFTVKPDRKYRLYVKVEDKPDGNHSGVVLSGIKGRFDNDFSKESIYEFHSGDEANWYYVDLKNNDLSMEAKKFCFQATDQAGNVSDVAEFGAALKSPDMKIRIDETETRLTVEDEEGNYQTVNYEKGKLDSKINVPYVLTVQASSGYMLDTLYIGDGDTILMSYKVPVAENIFSEEGKRYVVTHNFTIPEGTDLNVLYNSLEVYAVDIGDSEKNVDPQKSDAYKIGKMLYDNTKPEAKKADGTPLIVEPRWMDSFSFDVKVTSGPQATESTIKKANYKIENSAANQESVALSVDGKIATGTIDVPESKSPAGTKITFYAEDEAGNILKERNVETVVVDKTSPEVKEIKINGSQSSGKRISGLPVIQVKAEDNLGLAKIAVSVVSNETSEEIAIKTFDYTEQQAVAQEGKNAEAQAEFQLALPAGMSKLADGQYNVFVYAYDKAGRVSERKSGFFRIDNTAPVINAKVASGTMGGKLPGISYDGTACDYYYRSDVAVSVIFEEENWEAMDWIITDNGKTVENITWTKLEGNKREAKFTVTSNGRHTIKASASDDAGNKGKEKQISFIKDVSAPSVSAMINGGRLYTESMGEITITGSTQLTFSVSDANDDVNDFNYRVTRKLPDQAATVSNYLSTQNRTFSFTEDGEYTINAYSVDMAGNKSPTRTIQFRLDTAAPDISVAGGGNGVTSGNATTLSFVMKEAFWWDASGTVNIYRKAGDSSGETLFKTIDYKPVAQTTSISETLTETGVYRIEFEARDRAGHTATTSSTFTIDRDAPVVTLSGVKNYDMTGNDVSFSAQVTDDFYASKKVTVVGTRQDISGKKNPIAFSSFNQAGNPTIITENFKESGIYDIMVTAEDAAGNKDIKTVHFTIDKDKPVIGDIPIKDGDILKEFVWDVDLEDLVTDLTVCKVHMYLNGSEYDGTSKLEDGSYTLLITAEDENGNFIDNNEINFVIDTKAPTFVVTGVEDGEAKLEPYSITVSLQLDEDVLESVELNGKKIDISGNSASFDVTNKGDYKLTMRAVDKAGNVAEQTIKFTYGEKHNWWWLLIVAGVLLLGGIIFVVAKKKKEES